jgi:hypothetical protein
MRFSRAGRHGQASFEYLFTYGWAIFAAIIAIGALSYFGFISPSSMLPNKCNFGKQLECVEYQVFNDGTVNLKFRNNFGKPINIIDVQMVSDPAGVMGSHPFAQPVAVPSGGINETSLSILQAYRRPAGEKQSLNLAVNFTRADIAGSPSHVVHGYVYVTVSTR